MEKLEKSENPYGNQKIYMEIRKSIWKSENPYGIQKIHMENDKNHCGIWSWDNRQPLTTSGLQYVTKDFLGLPWATRDFHGLPGTWDFHGLPSTAEDHQWPLQTTMRTMDFQWTRTDSHRLLTAAILTMWNFHGMRHGTPKICNFGKYFSNFEEMHLQFDRFTPVFKDKICRKRNINAKSTTYFRGGVDRPFLVPEAESCTLIRFRARLHTMLKELPLRNLFGKKGC